MQNSQLPAHIKTQRDIFLKNFIGLIRTEDIYLLSGKGICSGLTRLFSLSNYAAYVCLRWPHFFINHVKEGSFDKPLSKKRLCESLEAILEQVNDKNNLMHQLRLFRHNNMLHILWRDINNIADIEETMKALSSLAECCIDSALNWLYQHLVVKLGYPVSNGVRQQMVVLGMGKLGGGELNFSSDIDLIFCYPQPGKTEGGTSERENRYFFSRLGQSLIKVLNDVTESGFVYRVDTRLRPYGSSGALVWSFDAMEQYYQTQGRDWERYAFVKARPVAGDISMGKQLLNLLKPFIYRRYLDFSTIEFLRNIKALMYKEELKKGMHNDIKRGSGGIREIEFIIQSFQLIYGGKKYQLQQPSLLAVLQWLIHFKFLPQEKANKLREIYLFFRRVEHLVQAWEDQQTHIIPVNNWKQSLLAIGMNYTDEKKFTRTITQYRAFVKNLFSTLVTVSDQEIDNSEWILVWESKNPGKDSITFLEQKGFKKAEEVYEKITQLRNSKVLQNVSQKSLPRINRFIVKLLQVCQQQPFPDLAILQSLPVAEKILRRTSYLVLLLEKPVALQHLVKLCSESLWIAQKIVRHPVLIDEFLDPGNLYDPPPASELQQALTKELAHINNANTEEKLTGLCYFKIAHMLKSVIAQVNNYMSFTEVSSYMTAVAESITKEVINISWSLTTNKYGYPKECHQQNSKPFIVLGYGKLGSMEIGPASDLDLVFIHNTDIHSSTSGLHSIDNPTFFSRFVQKVIGLLSMQTSLGKLYNIDVRLRPSGNAGLLVSSFDAFSNYQKKEAWTWECQALIKARVIAGDDEWLKQAFTNLRNDILQQKRDLPQLQQEFRQMRQKMKVLDKSTKQIFDLKYAFGCIVDIEFIVQYMILAHAHKYPALIKHMDNISVLKQLSEKKLLNEKYSSLLQTAYLVLMQISHQRARQYQDNVAGQHLFIQERNDVIKVWNQLFNDDLPMVS